jgi:hypothetical protein
MLSKALLMLSRVLVFERLMRWLLMAGHSGCNEAMLVGL